MCFPLGAGGGEGENNAFKSTIGFPGMYCTDIECFCLPLFCIVSMLFLFTLSFLNIIVIIKNVFSFKRLIINYN